MERDPPPVATPVTFPNREACSNSVWNHESPPPKLQPLFSKISKPSGISLAHVEALNIRVLPDCSPDALVPPTPDGTSYLPPLSPAQAINAASYADAVKVDKPAAAKRKEWDDRLTELRVDNDTGYRIISRTTKPGAEKAPKLGHLRKFWEGLESMAQYWDTGLDQYYGGPTSPPGSPGSMEVEGTAKRQRLDSPQFNHDSNLSSQVQPTKPLTESLAAPPEKGPLQPEPNQRLPPHAQPTKPSPDGTVAPEDTGMELSPCQPSHASNLPPHAQPSKPSGERFVASADTAKLMLTTDSAYQASRIPLPDEDDQTLEDELSQATRSRSPTPEPISLLRYKGRRTGSGRDMPEQFRVDTVRGFIEGAVWPFASQLASPRRLPVVQIKKLNLPVRQTAAVYRMPKERSRSRQGYLEGPIFSIQVRPDTDFEANQFTERQRKTKARLDTMRELGGLLQIAQERNRQGKTELRPGEGKWWTMKPRWGGGPGGEVEENQPVNAANSSAKDVPQVAEERVDGTAQRDKERESATKGPNKKTLAMLWAKLRCGSKTWDSKTQFEAIGKDPGSSYDEVFMVSSLNHHISILKLTVHTAYLDYINTEELPSPLPEDSDWCSPKLQRTQWYDLLDVDQRVQAFRALWGMMSYLTRDTTSAEAKAEAAETAMIDS